MEEEIEMSVAVVIPCNLYNAPYSKLYFDILNTKKADYEIIIWNRDLVETYSELKCKSVNQFKVYDKANNGNPLKFLKFIRFASYVRSILRKKGFSKIIFLGSYAWVIALNSFFLARKFKKQYFIDIRDYTYENNFIYSLLQRKAIYNSYSTSISSVGFMDFLPEFDYVISHNIDINSIQRYDSKYYIFSDKIRISFIGLIRYQNENEKLLLKLKNDNRFVLQFYGSGAEKIRQFCLKNNIQNTDFHDRFLPEKTIEFYYKTDIINNYYGNSSIELTTALSNKLYFSLFLKKPILVSSNTFMKKVTNQCGLGFDVDEHIDNLGDDLYNWYTNINVELKKDKIDYTINKIKLEEDRFKMKLYEFLNIE